MAGEVPLSLMGCRRRWVNAVLFCVGGVFSLSAELRAQEPATVPSDPDPAEAAGAEVEVQLAEPEVEAADLEPEDEVVVLATRIRRTPGSVHVVGSEVLERYKYDDPHATLQLVPGVYVRQEDGFGLRPNIGIRGAVSDRSQKVALLEDGVLFGPAPYSAPAAYYFPVIGRMRQMQVIKGPSAIKYGPQSVGGAIDLVTRPAPLASAAGLDVALGQFGYGKLHGHFGSADAQNAFLIEGIHLRSDGFKELPSGDETGFYRNEWMVKGSHAFDVASDLQHQLSLKLTYSDEQSDETYLGLSDEDFRRIRCGVTDRVSTIACAGIAPVSSSPTRSSLRTGCPSTPRRIGMTCLVSGTR